MTLRNAGSRVPGACLLSDVLESTQPDRAAIRLDDGPALTGELGEILVDLGGVAHARHSNWMTNPDRCPVDRLSFMGAMRVP